MLQKLCTICFLLCLTTIHKANSQASFVETNGTLFSVNGKTINFNGFNAYWMMIFAANPSTRPKVSSAFEQASKLGINLARVWGFSDGGDLPLQKSPGVYVEDMFRGLDFVVSEAGKHGIHVIISLVNNFGDYGGRKQYVEWGREKGQKLGNEDEFYSNPLVKQFYKNHIKAVLTRTNTISKVVYKDDPTIFAWELMNEPRCESDPSGTTLQKWIEEMGPYTKSIDSRHLLGIGLEGWYGNSVPERKQYNPNTAEIGTDFISNHLVHRIDFATIHMYPESWLPPPANGSDKAQQEFVDRWIQAHIEDCSSRIKKPLIIGEFGKSYKIEGYNLEKRDAYFAHVYDAIYNSVKNGGPCRGGIFWQLMGPGMVNMADGYDVVLEDSPSTSAIIANQSHNLAPTSVVAR